MSDITEDLRRLANTLINFGVGGLGPKTARPFGFSSSFAPGGCLALVSFLKKNVHKNNTLRQRDTFVSCYNLYPQKKKYIYINKTTKWLKKKSNVDISDMAHLPFLARTF